MAIFIFGGIVLGCYYGSLYHPRSQGTIVRFVVALVSQRHHCPLGQVIVCTIYLQGVSNPEFIHRPKVYNIHGIQKFYKCLMSESGSRLNLAHVNLKFKGLCVYHNLSFHLNNIKPSKQVEIVHTEFIMLLLRYGQDDCQRFI